MKKIKASNSVTLTNESKWTRRRVTTTLEKLKLLKFNFIRIQKPKSGRVQMTLFAVPGLKEYRRPMENGQAASLVCMDSWMLNENRI